MNDATGAIDIAKFGQNFALYMTNADLDVFSAIDYTMNCRDSQTLVLTDWLIWLVVVVVVVVVASYVVGVVGLSCVVEVVIEKDLTGDAVSFK
jgi:t-SNARE complex subunit (syntaxin)